MTAYPFKRFPLGANRASDLYAHEHQNGPVGSQDWPVTESRCKQVSSTATGRQGQRNALTRLSGAVTQYPPDYLPHLSPELMGEDQAAAGLDLVSEQIVGAGEEDPSAGALAPDTPFSLPVKPGMSCNDEVPLRHAGGNGSSTATTPG